MKAIRDVIVLVAAVIGCVLSSCGGGPEGHYTYYTNPVAGPVAVYQTKDLDAPLVTEIYDRQQVEMLGTEGSWARIVAGQDTGYVLTHSLYYEVVPYAPDEIEAMKSAHAPDSDIADGANLFGIPWYAWLLLLLLPLAFPQGRKGYRWILFVPAAVVGVFLYSVIWPIFGFYTISGWTEAIIMSILGYALPWWLLIVVDILNLLLQFYLLMLIGSKLCPNPRVGMRVCGVVGLLLVLFNTWDSGNVAMFSFVPNEENINWPQAIILLIVAIGSAIYPFTTSTIDD